MLDPSHMWSHTACGIETQTASRVRAASHRSHVISYRLRYWNAQGRTTSRNSRTSCHMWSHTACGIETAAQMRLSVLDIEVTCDLIPLAVLKPSITALSEFSSIGHMWSHTACGIETHIRLALWLWYSQVTCDLIPLAVLKRKGLMERTFCLQVTCDLIPLAVLKLH